MTWAGGPARRAEARAWPSSSTASLLANARCARSAAASQAPAADGPVPGRGEVPGGGLGMVR